MGFAVGWAQLCIFLSGSHVIIVFQWPVARVTLMASLVTYLVQASARASPGTAVQNTYLCLFLWAVLPPWMEAGFQEQAFQKPDRSCITCYGMASEATQCHICHIWFVRRVSLSLVFIQDSWGISFHLLVGRVLKNRFKFQHRHNCLLPLPPLPDLFLCHSSSFQ